MTDNKNVSLRSVKKKKSGDGKAKQKKGDEGDKSAKSTKNKKRKKLNIFGSLFGGKEKQPKETKTKKSKESKKKSQSALSRFQPAPSDDASKDEPSKDKEQQSGGAKDLKLPELSPEGQKGAAAFLAHFQGLTSDECSTEFSQVNTTALESCVSEDLLTTASDPKIPCIEATAVKPDGAFYHCNKITLEADDRQWIISQPPKDSPEVFWRMVFDEQAPIVVILGPAYDQGKKQYDEFFPEKKNDYKYYGKMYVNNKQVEPDGVVTAFTFEVLPEGCSNSLITKIVWSIGWTKGDMNQKNTCAKVLQHLHKAEPRSIVSVSASGTGRSCLLAAVSLLARRVSAGTYSTVVDLVVAMRKQRAMCIPDKTHYGYIYAMLAYYLMMRVKDKGKFEQALQRFKDTVAPGIAA